MPDVLLSDGTAVHLRQISPADADAVVAMHSRFSERTRYLRYFSPYPSIPARDLERFTNVDHVSREALVVEVGADLIGVGRYERLGPDAPDAEVAFVVEDAYQGRGVGSVLLEHLAAAAAQVGIERFVAEVLPSNSAMLGVFTDTGYELSRRYADGVVHLTFPVAPTQRSLAVQWEREHRTEARSVERLMRPSAVGVYGASRTGRGVGAALLAHLRAGGFAGPILPVGPPAGDPVPSRLAAAAEAGSAGVGVDLAVVAVPPPSIVDVVEDAAAAGVHGLLVITELDPAQRGELVQSARAKGMRVIGPGSLGLAVPSIGLNATLVPSLAPPGRIALFSQSGTLGLHLLAAADQRGLGLSGFISVGRRADVSGNDLVQWWADDPETDVIAMYLESFGNPRKFSRIARTVGRRKPIVVLASETGSSTLEPSAMEALRARSGVIEVGTVPELLDVAVVLQSQPLPAGDRIGLVSNASALTALAAARVRSAGLQVGGEDVVSPAATPEELALVARATVESPGSDAVVVIVAPPLPTGAMNADEPARLAPYLSALAKVGEGGDKPVVVTTYREVVEAVRALTHAVRRAAWLREPPGRLPEPIRAAVSTLDEALAAYDIAVKPSLRASDERSAVAAARKLKYPVAVKALEHPHRFDLGAVHLNLGAADLVRHAYADLRERFGPHVVVQGMALPGVACVVECRDDPAFGPVVGFGLGGAVNELVGDKAWRAAPLTDRDARAMLLAPKAAPLLDGADLAALEVLLVRVGQLADEVPGLRRLSLNTVLAHDSGYTVLNAEGILEEPAARPDSGPRHL
jgi:acyl-CoA synthetase (NDP forming)/GNAT superfamily N-acetyltransferase